MRFGLRLRGDAHDLASTHLLAHHDPSLLDAPWTVYLRAEGSPEAVATSEALTAEDAHALAALGLALVAVAPVAGGITLVRPRDLRPPDDDTATAPERWMAPLRRSAACLAEALPLRPVADAPSPDDGLLLLSLETHGAARALTRLLSLGRDDLSVGPVVAPDGRRSLLVRLRRPPMYLLLRARECPDEGVTAFARLGDGDVFVAWGYAHPLAWAAARRARDDGALTLIDAAGRWHTVQPPALRSVYDVTEAHLPEAAPARTMGPGGAVAGLKVPVRLEGGPSTEPVLWLLDEARLFALEPLVEALTDLDLERLVLARLEGPDGHARYLLQELVRPGVARLATRVSDLAGAAGYTRAAGTDNLYLPVGTRLVPPMRRDKLTALFGLDRHHAVLLDQDAEGPCVTAITEAETQPLTAWLDYVLTDRRHLLQPMLEDCVFDWAPLRAEPAPRKAPARPRAPAPPPPPRRAPAPPPQPQVPTPEAPVASLGVDPFAALRAQIRALEAPLAQGGATDADAWRTLGLLKRQVGEADDAAACLEAALFYGDRDPDTADALVAARSPAPRPDAQPPALAALVALPRPSPTDAALLGARVLAGALRPNDDPAPAAVVPAATERLLDPTLPVSRRLAWAALSALYRRTGDALGMTRARERLLGGLNLRGLSAELDLPRFARAAMALRDDKGDDKGDDEGEALRTQGAQVAVLDEVLAAARAAGLADALDPQGAYLRAQFAVGYARLGAGLAARELIASVEFELPVHEPPNRTLLGLYLARAAHVATEGDAAAWQREVEARVGAVTDAKVRDRVEHLRKRSAWLRTEAPKGAAPTLRASWARRLEEAEADPRLAPAALVQIADDRSVYDYERVEAVRRTLHLAAASGDDALLAETLSLATQRGRTRVAGAGFRAAVAGHCVVAAAQLGDLGALDALLDDIVTLAQSPASPQLWELLTAVRPAIASLRRFGAVPSALRFLHALAPLAERPSPQSPQLAAMLAEGMLRAGDADRADALLDSALDAALTAPHLPHADRFNAGAAALASLRYWPLSERAARVRRVMTGLRAFTDAFTASTLRLYATFQVLVVECLVDTVGDAVTYQGDRVQRFLDDEEQSLRRQIAADWRSLCGV